MNNLNEFHQRNLISYLKKKSFFIGIILLIIFPTIKFFYASNQKPPSLHINITKNIYKSIKNTSLANSISRLISTTIPNKSYIVNPIKSDETLCDNLTEFNNTNFLQNPCERIRCAVLLRSSAGRLGNRMFSFASAYGLARTQNCRLHVSKSILTELSNHFLMKSIDENMWLSSEEVIKLKDIAIKSTVCTFLPELLRPNAFKTIELSGYWQSYLYFDAYREEIREIFSSRLGTLVSIAKYLTDIGENFCSSCSSLPNTTHKELRQAFQTRYNTIWISIHIRRMDFLDIGYSSDDNYIRRAIIVFRRRYYQSKVRFLVASDDKPYCARLFTSEIQSKTVFILPERFSPADDLMILSLCHHSIVTGGTFGFWSAYLAGGEVIHDNRYQAVCSRSDYYPPWFMLVGPTVEKKA